MRIDHLITLLRAMQGSATDERRNEPNGFVAWGPLAITCLAKDAGVAIEVESDYVPANLLNGTWVGERTI